MSITGPRILDKSLTGCLITTGEATDGTATLAGGTGWESLDGQTFVNRTYFDISGYHLEQLTTFIQAVTVQEEFGPYGLNPSYIVDIVSIQSIDNADIMAAHITRATSLDDLPGFPISEFNMEQILYARNRNYASSVAVGVPPVQVIALRDMSTWGTGTASAGAKLYVTRIVYTSTAASQNQGIIVPPCNYVVALVVAKEEESRWMMNYRRSYEQEPR